MSASFHELLQQKHHNSNGKSDSRPCEQAVISGFLNPQHLLLLRFHRVYR
ncbi:hypothetical protein HanIR_Chr05g0234271 [Helianthus annuus]|nr:hypothetical protein HanIR_Chr05g0234271 [Helianthus annuus]